MILAYVANDRIFSLGHGGEIGAARPDRPDLARKLFDKSLRVATPSRTRGPSLRTNLAKGHGTKHCLASSLATILIDSSTRSPKVLSVILQCHDLQNKRVQTFACHLHMKWRKKIMSHRSSSCNIFLDCSIFNFEIEPIVTQSSGWNYCTRNRGFGFICIIISSTAL